MIANRILVCCSQNITGGPEVLHQLVDALRSLGHDAYISYYPFDRPFECPDPYRRYDAPQSPFVDEPGDLIVVPETGTKLLERVNRAEGIVWWLSVDNYYRRKRQSVWRDLRVRYKSLLKGRRIPLFRLRRYRHLAQSHYAREFLKQAGIRASLLTDYLGSEHLAPREVALERRDIVVYNPKKGQARTLKLRERNPDVDFVPIQDMTSLQVAELFASAKVYIDFGHHPGKDRLPREAAMGGCCVITGRQGSAANAYDVPLPDEYKLNDNSAAYTHAFGPLVESIFVDFASHAVRFDPYRSNILAEPAVFRKQVEEIFGSRQP